MPRFTLSSGARLASVDDSDEAALSHRTLYDSASDFCFVAGTTDELVLLDHRALTPLEKKVLRQKRRDESTLRHQHHDRMSNPQLSKIGVLVVGCGAAGEVGLSDLGFMVNAFCESDPEMNVFARRAFPDAVAFDTLGDAMSDVVARQEILLTTECVFLTPPCTDETALRDLNGHAATRTAHLFTDTQFKFVQEFEPAIVMYEMTPPKGDTHTSHHDVISRLEEPDYSTGTALIDASMVGDHTSHLRWFAVAVLDGPNIKSLLTPDLPYWPLPAAPCLGGSVVSHGAKRSRLHLA